MSEKSRPLYKLVGVKAVKELEACPALITQPGTGANTGIDYVHPA